MPNGRRTTDASGLMQMIGLNDAKQDEAHKRLRRDLDEIEHQLDAGLQAMRKELEAVRARMDVLEKVPVDATKLMMAPRVVVGIVVTVVTIAVSVLASNFDLRNNMRDVLSKMDVQNERAAALKAVVEAVQRDQRMTQIEVQALKESLLKMETRR